MRRFRRTWRATVRFRLRRTRSRFVAIPFRLIDVRGWSTRLLPRSCSRGVWRFPRSCSRSMRRLPRSRSVVARCRRVLRTRRSSVILTLRRMRCVIRMRRRVRIRTCVFIRARRISYALIRTRSVVRVRLCCRSIDRLVPGGYNSIAMEFVRLRGRGDRRTSVIDRSVEFTVLSRSLLVLHLRVRGFNVTRAPLSFLLLSGTRSYTTPSAVVADPSHIHVVHDRAVINVDVVDGHVID